MVTQFIAVDDQVSLTIDIKVHLMRSHFQSLSVVNKMMFQNCLVAMRPKSSSLNFPTTHDVANHLHNKFVSWVGEIKADIKVICASHSMKHQLKPDILTNNV